MSASEQDTNANVTYSLEAEHFIDDEETFEAYKRSSQGKAEAGAPGRPEYFDDPLIEHELEFLAGARPDADHIVSIREGLRSDGEDSEDILIGLALSGGGIRSATFSLGVMQRLAKARVLKQVDYLSTVSGGGYIGSALNWWLHGQHRSIERNFSTEFSMCDCACADRNLTSHPGRSQAGEAVHFDSCHAFPFGTGDPAHPKSALNPVLRYLRENGMYLIPGDGINIWSGIAIVLRAIFLNLLVWIPAVTALFALLIWGGNDAYGGLPKIGYPDLIAPLLPTGAIIPAVFGWMYLVAAALLCLFAFSSINYSTLQFTNLEGFAFRVNAWPKWLKFGVPLGVLAVFLSIEALGFDSSADRIVFAGVVITVILIVLLDIVTARYTRQHKENGGSGVFQKWGRYVLFGLVIVSVIAVALVMLRVIEDLYNPLAAGNGAKFYLMALFTSDARLLAEASPPDQYGRWFLLCVLAGLILAYLIRNMTLRGNLQLVATAGVLVLFFLAADVFAYMAAQPSASPQWGRLHGMCFLIFCIGLFLFYNFWAAEQRRALWAAPGIDQHYSERRSFEKIYGRCLMAAVILAIIGSVPVAHAWMAIYLSGDEGLAGIAVGTATTLWGFFRTPKQNNGATGGNAVITIGAALLLYGIAVVAYGLAEDVVGFKTARELAIYVSILFLALLSGLYTNINFIALHRFYRDRLMEAFLPDYETVSKGMKSPANGADKFNMCNVAEAKAFTPGTGQPSEPLNGPYHIINTNVMLTNAVQSKYRHRKGDSFIVSPLYSGSAATGWARSHKFMKGRMSVASAMAASAAAANPGGGAGGKGATTNLFVTLVMRFLNIRLSYWVKQPSLVLGDAESEKREAYMPRRRKNLLREIFPPNHFVPGFTYSIPGRGYKTDSALLELSDGAHFENLAVYELVRRRCGLIFVCDGGQDAQASYSDLINAIQRVGEDFFAEIKFNVQIRDEAGAWRHTSADDLIPLAPLPGERAFPKGAEYAKSGYFVATIDYGERGEKNAWPRYGVIIYMKTSMIPELQLPAKGYKGAHPDFPDETTGDQFFDEEQFEAYRELGYRLAEQVVNDLDLTDRFFDSATGTSRRPRHAELIKPAGTQDADLGGARLMLLPQ